MRTWVKVAIGAGVGLGALALLGRRGPRVGLFTGAAYVDEPGSGEALQRGGLSLCLKAADGTATREAECAPVMAWARGLGSDVSNVWGWHYLSRYRSKGGAPVYGSDRASAEAEGQAAAGVARALGASVYHANLEAPVFGTEGWPDPEDSAGAIASFVASFRSAAPGVALGFCGYTSRIGPEVAALFPVWSPMIYGSPSSDGAKIRDAQWERWAKQASAARSRGQKFGPLCSSGALTAAGLAWDYQLDRDGAPGLVSRAAAFAPDAVWFWYWGPSQAARMLTEGNAVNAPLWRAAGWIREAKRAGKGWRGTVAAGMVTS